MITITKTCDPYSFKPIWWAHRDNTKEPFMQICPEGIHDAYAMGESHETVIRMLHESNPEATLTLEEATEIVDYFRKLRKDYMDSLKKD